MKCQGESVECKPTALLAYLLTSLLTTQLLPRHASFMQSSHFHSMKTQKHFIWVIGVRSARYKQSSCLIIVITKRQFALAWVDLLI